MNVYMYVWRMVMIVYNLCVMREDISGAGRQAGRQYIWKCLCGTRLKLIELHTQFIDCTMFLSMDTKWQQPPLSDDHHHKNNMFVWCVCVRNVDNDLLAPTLSAMCIWKCLAQVHPHKYLRLSFLWISDHGLTSMEMFHVWHTTTALHPGLLLLNGF